MITIPKLPIRIERPNETPTEAEKFDDKGEWFLKMARWICYNYYNTYSIGNPQLNRNLATDGTYINVTKSIVDEMIENYSYYYGEQQNRIFNYLTTSPYNQALPNVWLRGQEIRTLVDHIKGKAIKAIEPIEKNISAESISKNSVLKKQDILDKIDIAKNLGKDIEELSGGDVKFAPAEIDYEDESSIEEARECARKELEEIATVITRSAYYQNNIQEHFVSGVTDTTIGNLTGIHFYERDGELRTDYVPCYNGIFDFSSRGEFGEDATIAGLIVPVTLDEILLEYKNLDSEVREEIEEVLYRGALDAGKFCEYWNQPFQNVKWWYNDQKFVTKATVYWIGRRDMGYWKKTNQFGGKRIQKIDPYKKYHVNGGNEMMLGRDLRGDTETWMIHKAVILGNKYLLEYGYDTYQVRPHNNKRKPILPISFLCQGKMAGYVKPIVSRLKTSQDELDAIRYKIREYTSQDLGKNYFIRGGKLGEGIDLSKIFNDLKTMHVAVIPETGDESDKSGLGDLIKAEDMTNHSYISEYLALKRDIENEMKSIVNITDIALGAQSTTIGKGVQEATLERSELSGISLQHSFYEYWRRTLQYAANKYKLILADNPQQIIPVSQREQKVLNLTKDFRFEDINVYINPDDAVENGDKALLKGMLHQISIAATTPQALTSALQGIRTAMQLMRFKSFGEGIDELDNTIKKLEGKAAKDQQQQLMIQQSQLSQEQQSAQIMAMQQQMAELQKELAKINQQGAWKIKEAEVKAGLDKNYQIDDAIIQNSLKQPVQ